MNDILHIRSQLPSVTDSVFLNTGTYGPIPRSSHAALVAEAAIELEDGRMAPGGPDRRQATMVRAREGFARLLGCDADEIALTHNTTEGVNIALLGLDWEPGDRIVTATTEHPGGLNPVLLVAQRYGAEVVTAPIGLPDTDPVAELERAMGPRTKVVMLSHQVWTSGIVLPIRELAEVAHRHGALFVCDGAQAAGNVAVDVRDADVDAYACSGQKWLLGPAGTGAVYLRRDRFADLAPTYVGYFSGTPRPEEQRLELTASAVRYEGLTLHAPSIAALVASMEWVDGLGRDWARDRAAELSTRCWDRLAELADVAMVTPREACAGLVHFRHARIAPAQLTAALQERGVAIRHTPLPEANRVSTGFYNDDDDIDALIGAVQEIGARGTQDIGSPA